MMRKKVISTVVMAMALMVAAVVAAWADGISSPGAPPTATDADAWGCTVEGHRADTLMAKGDPNGFLMMGRLYFFGLCFPYDPGKARHYLERAAAFGRRV